MSRGGDAPGGHDLRGEVAALARALRGRLEVERGLGLASALAPGGLPAPRATPAGGRGAAGAPPPRARGPGVPPPAATARPVGGAPPAPVGARPAPPAAPGRAALLPVAPPAAHAPAPAPAQVAPPSPPPGEVPGPRPPGDKAALLAAIEAEARACTRCRLAEGRTTVVVARGDPNARLLFVGEGPGAEEDRVGLPFVGPAGQLLDKIIGAMGLSPSAVYVANVVKCRPPGNRVPMFDEVESCAPFLRRQIAAVGPEVIVALGATAARMLLGTNATMAMLRGRWWSFEGVPLYATYHPAYLLRSPGEKRKVWDDMKVVLARLGMPVPER